MSKQIILTVIDCTAEKKEADEIKLLHHTDRAILDTLREGGIKLPSLCGINGKCGRCIVKFIDGVPLPTKEERTCLDPEQLRAGYRLACMAKPAADCVIEKAFVKEEITVVTKGLLTMEKSIKETGPQGKTFIAVDLGTTTIAMQLAEAGSGKILNTYTCLNPQGIYGQDVIARIRAGTEGQAEKLRKLAEDALETGIRKLEKKSEYVKLCKQNELIIAGNTTMGHLLLGYPVKSLGESPFKAVNIEKTEFIMRGRKAVILPGISAFVGADIVAGLYYLSLHNAEEKWMFLDLGTNAEMAAGEGKRLLCTSAAAGPAFENGSRDRKAAKGAERISAIAQLFRDGLIDETGLLIEPYFEKGIEYNGIFITQKDIREIQMAKAAVRSGIHFLKEKMGWSLYEDIDRIYLAGGLGFYLDKGAAAAIGLIPSGLEDKLIPAGNTSLAGAALYGQKRYGNRDLKGPEEIAAAAESFNLAEQPDFEQIYISYINF